MRSSPFSWINEHPKVRVSMVSRSFLTLTAVPQSIIYFELAGKRAANDRIVDAWSPTLRDDAFISLGVNYLYLFLCALTISLVCDLTRRRAERFARRTWIAGNRTTRIK